MKVIVAPQMKTTKGKGSKTHTGVWRFEIWEGDTLISFSTGYVDVFAAQSAANREYVKLRGQAELLPNLDTEQPPITRQERLI